MVVGGRGVVGLGKKSYLGSAELHFFLFFALVGVRVMNEGILFQRLHHKNTKFCTKTKFYHFWWLASENSKN